MAKDGLLGKLTAPLIGALVWAGAMSAVLSYDNYKYYNGRIKKTNNYTYYHMVDFPFGHTQLAIDKYFNKDGIEKTETYISQFGLFGCGNQWVDFDNTEGLDGFYDGERWHCQHDSEKSDETFRREEKNYKAQLDRFKGMY